MAKKKNDTAQTIDSLYDSIAKATGGEKMSRKETVRFFIDTGNLATNYVCSGKFIGGGIPGGRITEAYGPEASGKSLIGSNALFGCQQLGGWTFLLDCENASNGEFMEKVSHLNLDRVVWYAPSSLEKAFRQIHVTTKETRAQEKAAGLERQPILFVFDSLTVPPCERELRENQLPMDFKPTDWKKLVGRQEQPGERAKIISAEMRKLQSMVVEQDVTVYIINQTREKIGVLYGNPETTPGGKAMAFYSSLRLRTAAKKKIEDKVLGRFAGINMQVKNVKNRMFRPFVEANDIKLYFDDGVDCLSGLFNCLFEGERIKMKSQGNYYVDEKYLPDGCPEYTFKASKTENTIPMEVILDCPRLIDAETKEIVDEYISTWNSGLNATASGNYTEVGSGIDADGDVVEDDTDDE